MSFKSEIRDSQINELIEKVETGNYGAYLRSIYIGRARAFRSQKLKFDFPVTAIIGPNGGGKSTVLGAAALAYIDVKPSAFLAKSGKYDASMMNWSFNYELIDKIRNAKDVIRRQASFTRLKWYRDPLKRPIRVFGVSRTVPATERKELRKCISGRYESPSPPVALSSNVVSGVLKILDKDVSAFTSLAVDARGRVRLLAGVTRDGDRFSEFHFGAGESSIIRMLVELDLLPDNSLVLIEEIENGLHPVACIRLVEHLVSLALTKSLQVIFTTHSDAALRPLPDKAIWAAVNGQLFQGKLDIGALRAVTGQVDTALTIFVEDQFAASWIRTILRNTTNIAPDAIGVHAMEGDGIAVYVHRYHNQNPSLKHPSVCFIDGDSRQSSDAAAYVFRLPGQSPESYVYDMVMEKLDSEIGRLSVILLQRFEDQSRVANVVRSVRHTNRDPHLLYSQVGKQLGFLAEDRVKEAFLTVWAQSYPEVVAECTKPIAAILPRNSSKVPE